MPTAEVDPIDGAGKIDPSLFPVPSTLTSTLEARAAKLRTGGQNMQETGDDIVQVWGGLTNCYIAPESEVLYAALDPLTSNGAVTAMATNRVAGALEEFAETVHGIQAEWRELKADAYAFRAEIAEEGQDWDQGEGLFGWGDSSNVEKNDALLLRAANLVEDFKEAEVACANKINIGIDGRTEFVSEDDLSGAMPQANQFVHGVGVDLDEIPTSWGEAAASTDHGWVRDVGDAVWDFGVGAVEGVGAAVGAHSSEGWLAQSWGDSLKEYHWDNLTSAASLVGMYDAESDSLGWSGLDSAGQAWKDLAHSVVPWEEWGERPGYVIGTALLNIGATVGGAVLTATGVGAVVGVPLLVWRGMAILDGMGGSGRGGGGGSGVDLPEMPDMPTFGGAGAPVVNVDASNFTPAQAAQVTASLDRLNASTSGGGGGGGSSSSESSSGGGRSNQATSSDGAESNKPKKPAASREDPAQGRDEDSQTESLLPEQLKDESAQPWESTPGNAEALNQDPSSAPSLSEQPRVGSTLTTEDIFNPVSAESTRLRDELGGPFSALDEQIAGRNGGGSDGDASSGRGPQESGSPSRGPAEQDRQLVGASARGGNDGTLDQAANAPSAPLRNVDNSSIEPPGSNNGRPGNKIADNHGSGRNNPNLQDRGPTAHNNTDSPTPTRDNSPQDTPTTHRNAEEGSSRSRGSEENARVAVRDGAGQGDDRAGSDRFSDRNNDEFKDDSGSQQDREDATGESNGNENNSDAEKNEKVNNPENEKGPEPAEGEAKKREKPEWLQNMEEGNEFNRRREPYYEKKEGVNELYVGELTPKGGRRSVDSYVPNEEIVSRKHTQLSEVLSSTVFGYLKYQSDYYSPGTKIPRLPSTVAKLGEEGVTKIFGEMILEVPVQKNPPPTEILQRAEDLNITIRDENGKVWKLPDGDAESQEKKNRSGDHQGIIEDKEEGDGK